MNARLKVGDRIEPVTLRTIHDRAVRIPDPRRVTHLQLRRFAGCPVCNLHLQTFHRRRGELARAGLQEVILFHSTEEALRTYAAHLPLDIVADPGKRLYRAFGAESGARAMLDPRAWPKIIQAVAAALADIVFRGAKTPPLSPEGGRYGLPADFLIDSSGVIRAVHYGAHVDDQWSVDKVLALAAGAAAPARPLHKDGEAAAPAGVAP